MVFFVAFMKAEIMSRKSLLTSLSGVVINALKLWFDVRGCRLLGGTANLRSVESQY